jgi:hypothetical protein
MIHNETRRHVLKVGLAAKWRPAAWSAPADFPIRRDRRRVRAECIHPHPP